jgi:hypothetical protein
VKATRAVTKAWTGRTGGLPTHGARPLRRSRYDTVRHARFPLKRRRRHAEGTVPATVQTRFIVDATVITVPACSSDSRSRFSRDRFFGLADPACTSRASLLNPSGNATHVCPLCAGLCSSDRLPCLHFLSSAGQRFRPRAPSTPFAKIESNGPLRCVRPLYTNLSRWHSRRPKHRG